MATPAPACILIACACCHMQAEEEARKKREAEEAAAKKKAEEEAAARKKAHTHACMHMLTLTSAHVFRDAQACTFACKCMQAEEEAAAAAKKKAEEEAAAAAKKKAEEEARARAKEEAELREIFRLADTDRSGYIDETELLDLGKAVNPNFTPEKCRVLLNKMDTSRDGQLSPSEFIEFVFKFMEAFTAPQREKGLKEMRKAAEGLARKAEEARKQAEAELREIFKIADVDRTGYLGSKDVHELGKAANPKFTAEQCGVEVKGIESSRSSVSSWFGVGASHVGELSPDEFVQLNGNVMQGFTASQRDSGLKEMRKAAEGLARKAEEARKQAEAKAKVRVCHTCTGAWMHVHARPYRRRRRHGRSVRQKRLLRRRRPRLKLRYGRRHTCILAHMHTY